MRAALAVAAAALVCAVSLAACTIYSITVTPDGLAKILDAGADHE